MEAMLLPMLKMMIIRPQRNEYPSDISQNNSVRDIGGKKFMKKIYHVNNDRGNKLSCMFYEPVAEERPSEKMPVLIYMHGNAGCRLEAEAYVPHLLS